MYLTQMVKKFILNEKNCYGKNLIDLNDNDYEFGLTDFETYYMIFNVNSLNNKFYYDKDDKEIIISEELNCMT